MVNASYLAAGIVVGAAAVSASPAVCAVPLNARAVGAPAPPPEPPEKLVLTVACPGPSVTTSEGSVIPG